MFISKQNNGKGCQDSGTANTIPNSGGENPGHLVAVANPKHHLAVNQFHMLKYATAEQISRNVLCVGTSLLYCLSEPLNESKEICLCYKHSSSQLSSDFDSFHIDTQLRKYSFSITHNDHPRNDAVFFHGPQVVWPLYCYFTF